MDVGDNILMKRFYSLSPDDIRPKGDQNDLVTIVDEEAEKVLSARLTELLPGSVVVGEEGVAANPATLNRLAGEAPVWLIDPLDGTLNYANRRPAFGVIVALIRRGRTTAGWIYDPFDGRMAMGAEGEGAFLNGVRVRIEAPSALGDMVGALYTYNAPKEDREALEEKAIMLNENRRHMSSAQEYLAILQGRSHFAAFHRIKPWDHAAGALLLTEAGGHAAFVADEKIYEPALTDGSVLMAADRRTWRILRDHFWGRPEM